MSIVKGIALVTGSAQGIGRSIALRLARDGFDVALNDVPSKRDELRAVADDIHKIGQRTHLVPADVSIEGDVERMVQGTTEGLGGLDVVSIPVELPFSRPMHGYRWLPMQGFFMHHHFFLVSCVIWPPATWTYTVVVYSCSG